MNQEEEQRRQMRNRRKSDHDEKVRGVRIRVLNTIVVVVALFVSIVFLQAAQFTRGSYEQFESATSVYIECESAVNEMRNASNDLANYARSFVVTHDVSYLERYFNEANVEGRRGNAMRTLQRLLSSEAAQSDLAAALSHSELLGGRELYAMKLAALSAGIKLDSVYDDLANAQINQADLDAAPSVQADRAISLLFDAEYDEYLNLIRDDVVNCKANLVAEVEQVQLQGSDTLNQLLMQQQALTVLLLVLVVAIVVLYTVLVLRPLSVYGAHVSRNGEIPLKGAYELRYLAQAYNIVFEENQIIHEQLLNRAERDHLTGLYNRSVFERTIANHHGTPIALLLIDADYFKSVNDTLGHDGGDAMLQKVATLLGSTFRMTDYPCRIGGDEFAVIMTDIGPDLKQVVIDRIQAVREGLASTDDGLPVMTLSVGIAFSDGTLDSDQLYKNADKALYEVKEAGRNGYAFYAD